MQLFSFKDIQKYHDCNQTKNLYIYLNFCKTLYLCVIEYLFLRPDFRISRLPDSPVAMGISASLLLAFLYKFYKNTDLLFYWKTFFIYFLQIYAILYSSIRSNDKQYCMPKLKYFGLL